MKIDDEVLVTYADGELDAEQRAVVTAAIEQSPALAQRLEALTRAAAMTRSLYQAQADRPVPESLEAAILSAKPNAASSRHATPDDPSWRQRIESWLPIPVAAAAFASVALLSIGAWVGFLVTGTPGPTPVIVTAGLVPEASPMHTYLEHRPSGAVASEDGFEFEILASYIGDGRACREYQATRSDSGVEDSGIEHHAGIACRNADGRWQIAFAIVDFLAPDMAEEFYGIASDKLHETMDDFIRQHLGSEPVTEEREQSLIDSAWDSTWRIDR